MSGKQKNKFPIEVFPIEVQEYFQNLIDYNRFNQEYLCGAFIGASSIYIGNKYKARFSESYSQNLSTWVALVGNSSTKKTPVINAVFEPLMDLEKKRHRDFIQAKKRHLDFPDDPKPIERQSIVDDVTIESLYKIFQYNPQGILIKRDELSGFINDNGRYNSGGNEQKYLSLYSGVPSRINRRKDDESYMTEEGMLSMVGGIQPKILPELFSQGRDVNGFVQRMLFVINDGSLERAPRRGANPKLKSNYKDFCYSLEKIPEPDYSNIPEIDFTTEAYEYLHDWLDNYLYADLITGPYGELSRSYFGKIEAYTIKFSLMMEVLHREEKGVLLNEIGIESVKKAIKIANYFIGSFEEVLDQVKGAEKELTNTDIVIDYLNNLKYKKTHLKPITKLLREANLSIGEIAKFLRISKDTVHNYLK